MKRLALLGAAAILTSACAGHGPGAGPGPGYGPGYGGGSGPGPGSGYARGMRGPMMSPGWTLMTPEERDAHHAKMRSFRDAAECEAYMSEHHRLMQQRAQERGQPMPGRWDGPRPFCQHLK